jgi:hypothetical protein
MKKYYLHFMILSFNFFVKKCIISWLAKIDIFYFPQTRRKKILYMFVYKLWHQSNQTSNEKKVKLVFKLSERISIKKNVFNMLFLFS